MKEKQPIKSSKTPMIIKSLIFGLISIGAYALVFQFRDMIMEDFTRGGLYSALPIITVFFFSFVHGAFASNVLEVLGLHAAKKKTVKEPR